MKHELNINDFELDEITSIELIGEDDTIDITVEGSHMFYANDIYTHNSSMASEIVQMSQMGGSIKKAQIGHVVLSVGKTLEQKENKLATMTLLKSRIGGDGVVWQNCKFDNELLIIDTEEQNTLLGHREEQEQRRINRVQEVYRNSHEFRENAITTFNDLEIGREQEQQ